MPSQRDDTDKAALLQGTLDLLILRTLVLGKQHGQGIARSIQQQSEDVFLVDHGSLYLALQRLEDRGLVKAAWGVSENNRRARFYALTAKRPQPARHENPSVAARGQSDRADSLARRGGDLNHVRAQETTVERFH
jgi:PadR family transcriptional regulator